ncbi:MAG TPA: hypothetical protein VH703_02505 [Solirubrobacterales bacterium]|jgi:hypothetical protein
MKRSVSVKLSRFSAEALARGEKLDSGIVAVRLLRAIRFYLSEGGPERPGWIVPASLRKGERGELELELSADEDLIAAFEAEAARQRVTLSQLARQAALVYAAELDAGRITERLAEGLEREGPGSA